MGSGTDIKDIKARKKEGAVISDEQAAVMERHSLVFNEEGNLECTGEWEGVSHYFTDALKTIAPLIEDGGYIETQWCEVHKRYTFQDGEVGVSEGSLCWGDDEEEEETSISISTYVVAHKPPFTDGAKGVICGCQPAIEGDMSDLYAIEHVTPALEDVTELSKHDKAVLEAVKQSGAHYVEIYHNQ